jgi:hypothetical protein
VTARYGGRLGNHLQIRETERDRRERIPRLADLQERIRKFGLELHKEKTCLIEFGRYAAERRAKRGEGKPETFNFLPRQRNLWVIDRSE